LSSSVLNSLLISVKNDYSLTGAISTRFLVGDMLGVLVVCCSVIFFRRAVAEFVSDRLTKK